jgi:group I intron endonuclease
MDTIKREQYYIDILKPKYNILQTAGSSLGHKHTEETREKISAARLGQQDQRHQVDLAKQ